MSIAVTPGAGELTKEELLQSYRVMRTIREFEERLHREFATGEIPGFVHLYAGEEAIAAGVCAHLRPDDYIASTHRGHGHAIAKGCDVKGMMAEIYGKSTASATARAARCTSPTSAPGMLGANGIVGGGPPLVCGVGLSAKIRGTDQVGVSFTGDGGSNQGTFLESLNLASVWDAPCVFVVENNGYAEATSSRYHQKGVDVAKRADGFGMPGVVVDGHDFFAVHEAAGEAIARARAGGGPTLLECKVNRYFGHFEGDQQTYRGENEVEEIRAGRDCLTQFRSRVTAGEHGRGLRPELDRRRGGRADRRRRRRGQIRAGPDRGRPADRRLREVLAMARNITFQQAINEALRTSCERDPTVVLFGEDVAGGAGAPGEDDAWGGVLGVTKGLAAKFARARARHADLRVGVHRRRGRRRVLGPAPRRRADVRRLHGRLLRPDLQPGGEVPLHVRRQGRHPDGHPHDVGRRDPRGRRSTRRRCTRSSPTSPG